LHTLRHNYPTDDLNNLRVNDLLVVSYRIPLALGGRRTFEAFSERKRLSQISEWCEGAGVLPYEKVGAYRNLGVKKAVLIPLWG